VEPVVVVLGLAALLLVAVGLAGLYLSRRSALAGRVGSFACGTRPDRDESAWAHGIAQYSTQRLLWFRMRSLSPRPARSWSRDELTLLEREATGMIDRHGQPLLLVRAAHGEETFQMIMSVPACAGLVSWLESGPRPLGRVI
jgi:hypothetical protein